MKYSDFKQKVIYHMNNVVEQMLDKPEPGLWQGKGEPKNYILGNSKSQKERAELINKYALLPSVKQIDYKTLHLHPYAHHMNSSQIMCYNFFRPMMDEFDGKYKAKECLTKLIDKELGEDLASYAADCNFEHVDHEDHEDDPKENTHFDFYFGIRKGEIEVFFEIKYTEQYFTKSSSASNAHKQYEEVYQSMIAKAKDIFKGGTISEEVFNTKYYQLGRNAIRATTKDKHVFFVCSKKREDLIKQFEQFAEECLTEEGKCRVRLIYWEDLVEDALSFGINVEDFNKRYLDFLK